VEAKKLYKETMETERKVWQDKNADNTKRLLKENDTQQLWNGIRRLTKVKKQTKEVDPVKAREYFKGLLGTGNSEWGLTSENNVPRPEKRWKEELDREIDLEEIHSYLKKAKNGKAVGVDGYPMPPPPIRLTSHPAAFSCSLR
jgi:hypothetical protein